MKTCSIDGCNNKHVALDLCGKHYQAYRKNNPAGNRVQKIKDLDLETLRKLLRYDAETGHFYRLQSAGIPRCLIGKVAGNILSNGYWEVRLAGKSYLAHRLAWFYVYGQWAPEDIDHINRDRTDNRIKNLRLASRSQNMENTCGPQKNNKIGVRGVSMHGPSYRAQITSGGVKRKLGSFATLEEAKAAYYEARSTLHERSPE